jgi:hypothetical protein
MRQVLKSGASGDKPGRAKALLERAGHLIPK